MEMELHMEIRLQETRRNYTYEKKLYSNIITQTILCSWNINWYKITEILRNIRFNYKVTNLFGFYYQSEFVFG